MRSNDVTMGGDGGLVSPYEDVREEGAGRLCSDRDVEQGVIAGLLAGTNSKNTPYQQHIRDRGVHSGMFEDETCSLLFDRIEEISRDQTAKKPPSINDVFLALPRLFDVPAHEAESTKMVLLEWSRTLSASKVSPEALLSAFFFDSSRRNSEKKEGESNPERYHTVTAREILETSFEDFDFILDGILARNTVTLLYSNPKVGKTTFSLFVCRCMMEGIPALGLATSGKRVLYFSEESRTTLGEKLRRIGAGFEWPDDITFICKRDRENSGTLFCPNSIRQAMSGKGYDLVIVDTMNAWCGLAGDEENSSGRTGTVLRSLLSIAEEQSASMLVLHHSRKQATLNEDRSAIENCRGSSAIVGAVDEIVELSCSAGAFEARTTGRLGEEEKIDFRYDDGAYILNGGSREGSGWVLGILGTRESPMSKEDICTETGRSEACVRKALNLEVMRGTVLKTGRGKRGDPFVFSAKEGFNVD